MDRQQLYAQMRMRQSMLCVGLDTDPLKMPECVHKDVLAFNKAIVDATAPHCIAYKPNLAFYESLGSVGLSILEKTVDHIRTRYPEKFIIADAKRGDIGNTAKMYARAYFSTMDFDAVTVAPYMGVDSVMPFLEYKGKWVIVLGLTSNQSAAQFQYAQISGKPLYEYVMKEMMNAGTPDNTMFVVGATKAEKLADIRKFCPDNFFLVPGVGAQGGSAEEVMANGANELGGLLINSSRAILYASSGNDFAEAAASAAAATARYGIQ